MASSIIRARSVAISNVPEGVTDDELKMFMSDHMVSDMSVVQRILRPEIQGVVYVIFASANAAVEAIDILNGRKLKGGKVEIRRVSKTAEKDILSLLETNRDLSVVDVISSFKNMSLKEVSQVVDALQSALTPTSTSTSTRHEKTFPKVSTPKRRRLPQTPNSGVKFSQSPRVEGVRERSATSVPELVSYTHPPRLPLFSGLNDSKDATYRQWSYEVRALYRDKLYSDSVLLQAIRRSLKGPAAETLYNLGEIVDVNDILTKFDHVYGDVLSSGIILQQFYASNQTKAESVAAWACRLEDMVSKLTLKKPPAVSEDGAKSMLRLKFYNGLYSSSVRQLLRHRYDSGATFDELLVEARTIELEEQGRSPLTCKVQQSSSEAEDKIDKLLEGLCQFRGALVQHKDIPREKYMECVHNFSLAIQEDLLVTNAVRYDGYCSYNTSSEPKILDTNEKICFDATSVYSKDEDDCKEDTVGSFANSYIPDYVFKQSYTFNTSNDNCISERLNVIIPLIRAADFSCVNDVFASVVHARPEYQINGTLMTIKIQLRLKIHGLGYVPTTPSLVSTCGASLKPVVSNLFSGLNSSALSTTAECRKIVALGKNGASEVYSGFHCDRMFGLDPDTHYCRPSPSVLLNFHPNYNLTGLNITCLKGYRVKALNLTVNLWEEIVMLVDNACGQDNVEFRLDYTGLVHHSVSSRNPFAITLIFMPIGLPSSKLASCLGDILQPIREKINSILFGLHIFSHYLNCPAIVTAAVNVTQDWKCEHYVYSEYNRIGWCDRPAGPDRRCPSEPCSNGGSCINSPAHSNGVTCLCKPEFTGRQCKTPITTDPELRFQLSHGITWSDPLNKTCTIHYVKKAEEILTQNQNLIIGFISSCAYTLQPGFEVQFNMSQNAGEMIVFSGILTPTQIDTNLTLFDTCMTTVTATASSLINILLSGASTPGCPALQLAPGAQLVARPSWSCPVGDFVYNGESRSCEIN